MGGKNLFWVVLLLGAVTALALIGLYLLQADLPTPPPDPEYNLSGLLAAGKENSWSKLRSGEFGPVVLEEDGGYHVFSSESSWRVTATTSFEPVLVSEKATVLVKFREGRWFGKVSKK
jgi:hypothetical protein